MEYVGRQPEKISNCFSSFSKKLKLTWTTCHELSCNSNLEHDIKDFARASGIVILPQVWLLGHSRLDCELVIIGTQIGNRLSGLRGTVSKKGASSLFRSEKLVKIWTHVLKIDEPWTLPLCHSWDPLFNTMTGSEYLCLKNAFKTISLTAILSLAQY